MRRVLIESGVSETPNGSMKVNVGRTAFGFFLRWQSFHRRVASTDIGEMIALVVEVWREIFLAFCIPGYLRM